MFATERTALSTGTAPLCSTDQAASGWLAPVTSDSADPVRQERRDELAAILETALDCIIIMDETGCIVEFNPAAERTFGYRRGDVLGQLLSEKIIPAPVREMHRRGLARYLATGEAPLLGQRIEVQAMRADQSEFPAELTITAIRRGEKPLFTAYLRDLTEKKQLAQANEAAVRRWQLLFDKTPLSVQIFAPDGATIAVNEAWGRLFQMPRAQILGWNVLANEPLAESGADAEIARAFAGEVVQLPPRRYEICGDPMGTGGGFAEPLVKWVGALLYPVLDDTGRVTEVVCIHDDATERQQTELAIRELNAGLERQVAERTAELLEALGKEKELSQINAELADRATEGARDLLASQEQFYKAFHASPAAMTLMRLADARYVDVNAAFCKASGHTREQAIGRTGDELDFWVVPAERDEFLRVLQREGRVRDMELTLRSRDGRVESFLASVEIIEINREPHALSVALDITARKRAEVELQKALEREKELSRLKSSFVSMVSHEFRTPLGIILSSSEILDRYLETLDAEERREQLGAIGDAVRRMSGLMEQVLMFSRIESGQLAFRPQPHDLADFLRQLHDELISATGHRCPIEFVPENSLAGAIFDENLLRHTLTNLLTNAVKYSRCTEPVRFVARREGRHAVFEVIDRGLGIPAAELDRLFTAFHRARNVADLPGTGLGLVIVRKCLETQGGEIDLQSIEGEGTTVRVTLPLFPNS